MSKRQEERLALEGNSVFTDLRMERDALKEQNAALLEALELIARIDLPSHDDEGHLSNLARGMQETARAAIRQVRGENT